MNIIDIRIGMLVDAGGYVAEVIDITPQGVVIECEEIGQDIYRAEFLKPLGRGMASDDYGDIADQYDDEPYRPVY